MEVFQHQLFSLVGALICFCSMGEWAVVTGAGDGIGKVFLAGWSLVLGFSLVTELATDQKVKVIQAVFTKNSVYENIEKDLKDLSTAVLVSNVGILHNPLPSHFLNGFLFCYFLLDCVNCNIISVPGRYVTPSYLQKVLILNLSSGSSTFPCPVYMMYTATKVNLSHLLLQPLQAEYKAKINIMQIVIPYGVSAPMTMYQNPGVITKTAEKFLSESLEYVTFGDRFLDVSPMKF
uniref:Uncharacterized protein n=1 Tax=Geospiza parvula TaxID=87175 RepID=A0A8C3MH66_GEOPR